MGLHDRPVRESACRFRDGVRHASKSSVSTASNWDRSSRIPIRTICPEKSQREELMDRMQERGLAFSGIAANLWGEKLINTDDQSKYIAEFRKNSDFARDLGIAGIRVDCVQPPTIHREVDYADGARPRCEDMEDLLRHRRGQRSIRDVGVRAGLRLQ